MSRPGGPHRCARESIVGTRRYSPATEYGVRATPTKSARTAPAIRGLTPEAERSLFRDRFVRSLKGLTNFDPDRVHVGGPVRGEHARHWLDVAIVGAGTATAFAHAIPLGAADERPVFMHRGLVLEAAADMPPHAPRLALHDDPPESRRELFDETRSLLGGAGVEMVSQGQLTAAAAAFDEPLWKVAPH